MFFNLILVVISVTVMSISYSKKSTHNEPNVSNFSNIQVHSRTFMDRQADVHKVKVMMGAPQLEEWQDVTLHWTFVSGLKKKKKKTIQIKEEL